MQHNRIRFVLLAVFILLCNSSPLIAGPLDRSDMGPRVNPATNDMLRVPGVVGMDYQSAMGSLQQAGLNPRVHMIHKKMKKYAGQEGMVVKQLPLAGGMAMLGSSVSITVYAPGNMSLSPDNPPDTGYGTSYPDQGAAASGGDGNNGSGYPDGGDTPVSSGSYPSGSDNNWSGPTQAAAPDSNNMPVGDNAAPSQEDSANGSANLEPKGEPVSGPTVSAQKGKSVRHRGTPIQRGKPVNDPTVPAQKGKPVRHRGTPSHRGKSVNGPTVPAHKGKPVHHRGTPSHRGKPVNGPTVPAHKGKPVHHSETPAPDKHPARPARDKHPARPARDKHPARPARDKHPARPARDKHPSRPAPDKHPARPAGGWHIPGSQADGNAGSTHAAHSSLVPRKPEGHQSLLAPNHGGQ